MSINLNREVAWLTSRCNVMWQFILQPLHYWGQASEYGTSMELNEFLIMYIQSLSEVARARYESRVLLAGLDMDPYCGLVDWIQPAHPKLIVGTQSWFKKSSKVAGMPHRCRKLSWTFAEQKKTQSGQNILKSQCVEGIFFFFWSHSVCRDANSCYSRP